MEDEDADEVRELARVPRGQRGRPHVDRFLPGAPGWTVGETLANLQKVDEDLIPELDEIPLVDDEGKLFGIVPSSGSCALPAGVPSPSSCAARCARSRPSTPFREVVERFEKYHLRALAVVDEFGDLKGMINIEDVLSRLVKGE